jgi:hypothetical protein
MSLPERVIALEIRASKFGFAVLERQGRLLDWGVRSFGEQSERLESTASDRINTLLEFYNPVAVVVKDRQAAVQAGRLRPVFTAIEFAARRGSATFHVLNGVQMRNCLGLPAEITKHEIAKILAERFEELSFKLPNRRKVYESEAPAMLVFDALATGVAFLEGNAL